ncbi:MAG: histidinol-phosphate aminotransferase [Candidatus Methanomethylophilaceae archaeon]|nr:histidinol-phosphate aminotransferase [Candidatus Methanomethylophilaceae archaeon]
MMDRSAMRSSARHLQPYYSPNGSGFLRLDTNTNVLGPNPAARKALKNIEDLEFNQYPSTYSLPLRNALASFYGLSADNFVTGSGSDEILDVLFKTFVDRGNVVTVPYPSYSIYEYFSHLNGAIPVLVDLDDDFQLDVDPILESDASLIIVPCPNNPTGNAFRERDLLRIVMESDCPVVIDEAYGEFYGKSFIPLVKEYDNLIVTRTFSKAYAMAGLRVGYCIADPSVTEMMTSVRIPYSLNMLSEKAAIAALGDQEFIKQSAEMVKRNRPLLINGLEKLGFHCFPSESNFVLARSPIDHRKMVEGLRERNILIRDFGSHRRLENCIRFTVGTEAMIQRLLDACCEVIE